jgi:hypothetical protein
MALLLPHGATEVILRFDVGVAGLAHDSTGLRITVISNKDPATTQYRQSESEIETVGTLGTYATPTADKCRFRAIHDTEEEGLVEIHLANSHYAVAGATTLVVTVWHDDIPGGRLRYEIQLNPQVVISDALTAAANKLADIIKRRRQAATESASDGDTLELDSIYGLIQQAQSSNTRDNEGQLTIYESDGATELGRLDLTTDPTARPIDGVS